MLFCRLEVFGLENIPKAGPFLLASNHLSYLDPVVLGASSPKRLRFIARSTLFQVPLLGWLVRSFDTIPIRRGEADLMAMRESIRRLKAGQVMAIFPEGTRQRDGQLGAVKSGFGFIVAAADVPVVPVVIRGTREVLPPGAMFLRPHKIRVAFGPGIAYSEIPVAASGQSQTPTITGNRDDMPALGKAGRKRNKMDNRRYDELAQELTSRWRRLASELSTIQ